MSLDPNAMLPCGTDSARRRHSAHGEICLTCEPDAEWMTRCPDCRREVTAVGGRVERHTLWGVHVCSGGGLPVDPPKVLDRPIWSPSLLARDGAA